MVGLFEWYSTSPTEPGFLRFTFGLMAVNAAAMAAYFSARFYRQWLSVAREAERVFAALGYADPSRVDLPHDHKRYCKAHGIKWPYLTDGPWIYHYIDPR